MRRNSITYKLIGTFTLIVAVILIQIGIVLSVGVTKNYEINRSELLQKQFQLIENSTVAYLNQSSETAVQELRSVLEIVKTTLGMDCLIIDSAGYINQMSSDKQDVEKYTKIHVLDSGIDMTALNGTEEIKFVDDKDTVKIAYAKAIFNKDKFSGVIFLVQNEESISAPLKPYFLIWGSIVLALILPMCIAYYFVNNIIIKPLEAINSAAKKLSKGEVEKRVYINSNDEIGELAESFNTMAESLQEVDTMRRDFISNVSHELRSPITSIKGFITGILDGVIPKDKENYYLNIVNDEVSRLSRLVNDLLDISSMESGKFNLNMNRLDVNQLVTLCTLNLDGKIQEKNISVEVIFNNKHEYGIADRDRIIQVITNILENAIKYGKENGIIKIETYTKGDKILVSIFNNGPTIAKEEINNIWDRFYKSDKARTNKISTGLGLPIVRLILSQHGEDIWVNNIEGKGVEFIFTIKKDK